MFSERQESGRRPHTQEGFLRVIHELESKGLLDEITISLIKSLILEENIEVIRVINAYIMNTIDQIELGYRL